MQFLRKAKSSRPLPTFMFSSTNHQRVPLAILITRKAKKPKPNKQKKPLKTSGWELISKWPPYPGVVPQPLAEAQKYHISWWHNRPCSQRPFITNINQRSSAGPPQCRTKKKGYISHRNKPTVIYWWHNCLSGKSHITNCKIMWMNSIR